MRSGSINGVMIPSTKTEDAVPRSVYSGVTSVSFVTFSEEDWSLMAPSTPAKVTRMPADDSRTGKFVIETRTSDPPISGPESRELKVASGMRSLK